MLGNDAILIDVPVFTEGFWLLWYLAIYMLFISIVFEVRKYRQRKSGVFESVDVLPLGEQIIRTFNLVIVTVPFLVWLLWHSDYMFLFSYLLLCHFLLMTPQLQIPVLIRFVVAIVFFVDFARSVFGVSTSHLKSKASDAIVTEPIRERVVTERVITERVLIICPFCATKNEQGIGKCQNCGADL